MRSRFASATSGGAGARLLRYVPALVAVALALLGLYGINAASASRLRDARGSALRPFAEPAMALGATLRERHHARIQRRLKEIGCGKRWWRLCAR